MKTIKKIILLNIVIMLLLTFSYTVSSTEITVKTDDGSYNYTIQEEIKTNITDNCYYIKNIGYTTRSSKKYDQVNHIFVADFKKNSDNIKIATWAIQAEDGTSFKRETLLDIAKDYEAKHPGYIVLGGVNADQFYFRFGTQLGANGSAYMQPQPYYPMVASGENWFSINPYGGTYNVTGFKNDGSNNPLVYGNRTIKGLFIHIYDEDMHEIGMYQADDLNITSGLAPNKTTVLAAHKNDKEEYEKINKTSSNSFFVISNADSVWVSNSKDYTWKSASQAVNAFFGKGRITSVDNSVSLGQGSFAIETRNEELKSKLSVGTYVMCQYEFDDGFNGIEEAMGYHTIQRSNGKDGNVANSYNSRPYPRSIFGCDSEGRVYLVTCDGSNSSPTKGMYAQESNALLKYYGVTDAFQMDGGGSVTAIMRDENGNLFYPQKAIESSYRLILSGLFIIMRVPDVKIEIEKQDYQGIIFDVDLTNVNEKGEPYLRISKEDDVRYLEIVDGKVDVKNLDVDSDYKYVLCFIDDGIERQTFIRGNFHTYSEEPRPALIRVEYNKESKKYDIRVCYAKPYDITKITIHLGSREYNLSYVPTSSSLLYSASVDPTELIIDGFIKVYSIQGNNETVSISYSNISMDSVVYVSYMNEVINSFIDDVIK